MLKTGDVIVLKRGMRVYGELQARFVYSNTPKSKKLVRTDLPIGKFDEYPAGEYLVYKTTYDGGATGVGMTGHDDYPNGHHVFCYKINGNTPNEHIAVDFYQSGCFTAMITKISPVRKLTPKTTWK